MTFFCKIHHKSSQITNHQTDDYCNIRFLKKPPIWAVGKESESEVKGKGTIIHMRNNTPVKTN